MVETDDESLAAVMNRRMSRRKAISSGAKLGGAVVATAVVAGGLGYYAGSSTAPSGGTTTTTTVTSTVTGAASSTTSSGSTATSQFTSYPAWVGIWPLDFTPDNPVANLTGSCRSTQFDTITMQSNATIPGTRAYCTQQALMHTYPNVTWTNYDTGANGNPTLTALQAGQNNWDVTRGNATPGFIALGYLEPITEFYNAWEDKAQYTPAQMQVGQSGGDFYLLPDDADVHAGWWRMDLFAAAGYGTFDYKAFTYTGTTPNQMGYQELLQACQKMTSQGSSRNVYATYWMNNASAILGPWYCDEFLRANGGLKYWGDFGSCTVTMDQAPYLNNNLDSLTFLANNIPNYTPGYATLDLNALITNIVSGSMGFSFGEDPNLDGQMIPTAASKSNPAAPAGVNVRECIQPTVGWADGKPLDPNLPPAWAVSSYDAILRGATNPAAAWEWIRTYSGFPAWMLLLGNASGLPGRSDVAKIAATDQHADTAPWVAAYTGWTWADLPFISGFASVLGTAYTNTIDVFAAGTGTAEQCVTNYSQATRAALQKANIPAYSGALPT
jgi:hypothetical protein